MTPNEVIEKLEALGIKITRRTLLNYEKWEIIPQPTRGGGGAGGRWTNYPTQTVYEAYAAWSLMHGAYDYDQEIFLSEKTPAFSPKVIKRAKKWSHKSLDFEKFLLGSHEIYLEILNSDEFNKSTNHFKIEVIKSEINVISNRLLFQIWLVEYIKAKTGIPISN